MSKAAAAASIRCRWDFDVGPRGGGSAAVPNRSATAVPNCSTAATGTYASSPRMIPCAVFQKKPPETYGPVLFSHVTPPSCKGGQWEKQQQRSAQEQRATVWHAATPSQPSSLPPCPRTVLCSTAPIMPELPR